MTQTQILEALLASPPDEWLVRARGLELDGLDWLGLASCAQHRAVQDDVSDTEAVQFGRLALLAWQRYRAAVPPVGMLDPSLHSEVLLRSFLLARLGSRAPAGLSANALSRALDSAAVGICSGPLRTGLSKGPVAINEMSREELRRLRAIRSLIQAAALALDAGFDVLPPKLAWYRANLERLP